MQRRIQVSIGRIFIFLLFTYSSATKDVAASDLAYGEYLAGECVACHRPSSESAIPPINALPAPYFVEALREYRDGERDHALMRTVARSLAPPEMEALAAYFEQLEP
ncbi:MAG: c-type cytochrome [Geminicoccaceae bacterium]